MTDSTKCPKCGSNDWDWANIGFTNAITCLHCGSIRMKMENENMKTNYDNSTLSQYEVVLYEEKEDTDPLVFECMAEDVSHAEEQALNAYPNGTIVNVLI